MKLNHECSSDVSLRPYLCGARTFTGVGIKRLVVAARGGDKSKQNGDWCTTLCVESVDSCRVVASCVCNESQQVSLTDLSDD